MFFNTFCKDHRLDNKSGKKLPKLPQGRSKCSQVALSVAIWAVQADFGRDFGAQVAATWTPGPSEPSIPLQRGAKMQKLHFFSKSRPKDASSTPKL